MLPFIRVSFSPYFPGLLLSPRLACLLLLVVYLLSRRDALHVGSELVDGLHPLVVLVRVKDDTAAYFVSAAIMRESKEN